MKMGIKNQHALKTLIFLSLAFSLPACKNEKTLFKAGNASADLEALKSLPKFGMLANHWECGFCHMTLVGDMASSQTVAPVAGNSVAEVLGDWYIAGKFNAGAKGGKVTVQGETKEDFDGDIIPKSLPSIDMVAAETKARGTLNGSGPKGAVKGEKVIVGNTVLVGSDANPIQINGDILVKGDLIITGTYAGVGTIYATGNIFIPNDLKARKSIFPYPNDRASALLKAESALSEGGYDGLSLVTNKIIYIASVRDVLAQNWAGAKVSSPNRKDFEKMYQWFTKAAYLGLGTLKENGKGSTVKSVDKLGLNVIDAFLFAGESIEGTVYFSSFSIRGGIFTDYFNLVNANTVATVKTTNVSAVHGRNEGSSYVEYDWRLATGKYFMMERLGEALMEMKAASQSPTP